MLTTLSGFKKVMSGKPPSILIMAPLNSVLCLSDLLMPPLRSNVSWATYFLTYWTHVYLFTLMTSSIDHEKHVCEVLLRLQNNKLYACANKCFFHQDMVKYLGYILAPHSLTMDHSKVKVVQDWPEPHKVKDIQSFLGFANFYR